MNTTDNLNELEITLQKLTSLLTCLGAVEPEKAEACQELPYAIEIAKCISEKALVLVQNMK